MCRLDLPILCLAALGALTATAAADPPQYAIVDIGVLPVYTASQGFRVSPSGIATGRSVGTGSASAFSWTQAGGLVGLPSHPSRPYSVGNGVNNAGTVVGIGASSLSGSFPIPLIWHGGGVSQLPFPAGYTSGTANAVNAAGTAVGSVGGALPLRAAIYTGGASGSAGVISQTTPTGCFATNAFDINDSGRIVGIGIDPNNAARNVGYYLDTGSGLASEVGALPGMNGAICFGVGGGGHIVGSSMLNQGSGLPFIWSDLAGIQPIPLPAGASSGSARAVNAGGWAVGTASSAFAIPFLFDGAATYRLGDLIPAGSGWDLLTNTSSSALGISDGGVIVGTGVLNGNIRAYAMIPIPAPGALALLGAAGLAAARRRR